MSENDMTSEEIFPLVRNAGWEHRTVDGDELIIGPGPDRNVWMASTTQDRWHYLGFLHTLYQSMDEHGEPVSAKVRNGSGYSNFRHALWVLRKAWYARRRREAA